MKKFAFLLLILNVHFSYGSVKISPELDQFMVLRPEPEEHFNKNAYVGWLGINHAGDDWLTIGKTIFNYNDHILNEKLKEGRVAHNVYADKVFRVFQLPNNIETLDYVIHLDDELITLNDYLKEGESLLTFAQPIFGKKKYTETKDFFPCQEYLKVDCLENTKKNEQYIRLVAKGNHKILSRYRELMGISEMNLLVVYNDLNITRRMKRSPGTTSLYQLNLADASLDILNNKIDDGLEKLLLARRWIDLNYRAESIPLTSHTIAYISYTQYLDQTMDALLSSGLLSNYLKDERVELILKPYSDTIGQKLNVSILAMLKQRFKSIAYPYVRVYINALQHRQLNDEEEYIVLSYFQYKLVALPMMLLLRLQTLNAKKKVIDEYGIEIKDSNQLLAVSQEVDAELASYMSEQEFVQFFYDLGMTPNEALAYLNTKYPTIDFYNEYFHFLQALEIKNNENIEFTTEVLESLLKKEVSPDYIPLVRALISYTDFKIYWERLYEQQNYHRLVYLKYLIMKDNIKPNQIPEFLKSMGNLAVNTITQKPYQYDIKSKKLYTPLPIENKYLPVNIKDAKFDNRLIKDFEVQIP